MRALLTEALETIEALAGQQAMPDDFYFPVVERLRAAIAEPDCTCGFGGFHEELNPRCERNKETT